MCHLRGHLLCTRSFVYDYILLHYEKKPLLRTEVVSIRWLWPLVFGTAVVGWLGGRGQLYLAVASFVGTAFEQLDGGDQLQVAYIGIPLYRDTPIWGSCI